MKIENTEFRKELNFIASGKKTEKMKKIDALLVEVKPDQKISGEEYLAYMDRLDRLD